MKRLHATVFDHVVIALLLSLAAACVPAARTAPAEAPSPATVPQRETTDTAAPPGKPTAPIDIEYRVIGTAFVGQPVSIEIDVSSSLHDQPISLEYRINDPRDLSFAESQPRRVSLSAIGDAPSARRQVTIVPQREGRLYLNVSAEIETAEGTLMKAMSIPVQVGNAKKEAAVNGEIKRDADGEDVVSMPAKER